MNGCTPKKKIEKSIQTYQDASNFSFQLNKMRKFKTGHGMALYFSPNHAQIHVFNQGVNQKLGLKSLNALMHIVPKWSDTL